MTSLVLVCGMSRSGTTLLATMLDSHPEVSMGYELLPSDLPPAPVALALLAKAGESAGGDTATIARLLDHQGYRGLSRFVKRCRRALVDADELAAIIARLAGEGTTDLTTIAARAALARAVVETKRAKEGTRLAGFKLNSPSIAAFAPLLGDAAYVYIVRDPATSWPRIWPTTSTGPRSRWAGLGATISRGSRSLRPRRPAARC